MQKNRTREKYPSVSEFVPKRRRLSQHPRQRPVFPAPLSAARVAGLFAAMMPRVESHTGKGRCEAKPQPPTNQPVSELSVRRSQPRFLPVGFKSAKILANRVSGLIELIDRPGIDFEGIYRNFFIRPARLHCMAPETTMDGISTSAASGMRARMESLEMLANNLANVETGGFKADREFFSIYTGDDATADPQTGDISTLPVIQTPLDRSLSGQSASTPPILSISPSTAKACLRYRRRAAYATRATATSASGASGRSDRGRWKPRACPGRRHDSACSRACRWKCFPTERLQQAGQPVGQLEVSAFDPRQPRQNRRQLLCPRRWRQAQTGHGRRRAGEDSSNRTSGRRNRPSGSSRSCGNSKCFRRP